MIIRKATKDDIARIVAIYSAIHDEEESGRVSIGWNRAIYPVRETAEDAVARGDMFVEEDDGRIVATGIINQRQVPVYANCHWEYDAPDKEVMVLHTLVVDPHIKGHGYGTAFVNYYEQYAEEHGCRFLRMDTNVINASARKLYAKLGYKEPGIVPCVFNGIPNVQLVCLEKKLS
jgi:GNAT superfamily N-acetyltransferase